MMRRRYRLGMLTPSSNTALEPVTAAMLAGAPDVTAHFARLPVTEISLDPRALGQFDDRPMLDAAELLAHAKVDVICWNGTSAGWRGLEADRRLCERITQATGIAAVTSVLGLVDALRRTGVRAFGLVTPYTPDVQARIVAHFKAEGFDCLAERHLSLRDNFSFAEVGEDTLDRMVRDVAARSHPPAVTIFCTNLRAAPLVPRWEHDLDLAVYDTIATALHASLVAAGVDPGCVQGWGRLFADPRLR